MSRKILRDGYGEKIIKEEKKGYTITYMNGGGEKVTEFFELTDEVKNNFPPRLARELYQAIKKIEGIHLELVEKEAASAIYVPWFIPLWHPYSAMLLDTEYHEKRKSASVRRRR